jgi:Protein of unknown function (DUF3102)
MSEERVMAATVSVGTKGWADRINAAWLTGTRSAFEAAFEAGRILNEAKGKVPHGDFTGMVENDLLFNARTAQRLMVIAKDQRISNPTHVSLLPLHWGTLYELSKLKDEQFEAALKDGTIHPDMERKDVPRPEHRPRKTNGSTPPTITDAEFKDITESPAAASPSLPGESAAPVEAVPDPDASLQAAAHTLARGDEGDTREGGNTPGVILDDGLRPVAGDDHLFVALGRALKMGIYAFEAIMASGYTEDDAVERFPSNIPIFPDDLTKFVNRLTDFDVAFRVLHPRGNEAAMSEEARR